MFLKAFKCIILFYLVTAVSTALHEFCHFLFAYLSGVEVKEIGIGIAGRPKVRIRKLVLSPVLVAGYITIDRNALKRKSTLTILLIGLSGVLANIIIVIAAVLAKINLLIGSWLVLYNVSAIIISLLPFGIDNDMRMMIHLLNTKRER